MSLKNQKAKSLKVKKVKGLTTSRGPVSLFSPEDINNIAKFQGLFMALFDAANTFYDKLSQKDRYDATKVMVTCASMLDTIQKGLTEEQKESYSNNSVYYHNVLTHASNVESKSMFELMLEEISKSKDKAQLLAIMKEVNETKVQIIDKDMEAYLEMFEQEPSMKELIDLYSGAKDKNFFLQQVKTLTAFNKKNAIN